jgi:hypothetical protein
MQSSILAFVHLHSRGGNADARSIRGRKSPDCVNGRLDQAFLEASYREGDTDIPAS